MINSMTPDLCCMYYQDWRSSLINHPSLHLNQLSLHVMWLLSMFLLHSSIHDSPLYASIEIKPFLCYLYLLIWQPMPLSFTFPSSYQNYSIINHIINWFNSCSYIWYSLTFFLGCSISLGIKSKRIQFHDTCASVASQICMCNQIYIRQIHVTSLGATITCSVETFGIAWG